MNTVPSGSSVGNSPKSQNVYVEEDFDKNGNSLGFFVKTKGPPPKTLGGPFPTEADAIFWFQNSGYNNIPEYEKVPKP